MAVKMKIKYVKKKDKRRKRTAKKNIIKSRKLKKKRTRKNRKSHKNRLHLKHIPKRQLAKTLKKARRKIQKQLKKLYFKGGSKSGALVGNELPQQAGQSGDSMKSMAGAAMVEQQAGELTVVNPKVIGE